MAALYDYQEISFPRTGHEAVTLRLRNALISLTRLGNRPTAEHLIVFCMMFFFAEGESVSSQMLDFAHDSLRAWRDAIDGHEDAVLTQQVGRLEVLMDAREGIADYGSHSIPALGTKQPSIALLTAIIARFEALEARYKDAPVKSVERVCWTRKIRIKGREI